MAVFNFDASSIEPRQPMVVLPPGKYLATITASEVKPNKAGTGRFLELVFTIIEGEYRDSTLRARLNVEHQNETAVRIAMADLAAICRAVGRMQIAATEQLHGIPLTIGVVQKQRADTGGVVNEIESYGPVQRPAAQPSTTKKWGQR